MWSLCRQIRLFAEVIQSQALEAMPALIMAAVAMVLLCRARLTGTTKKNKFLYFPINFNPFFPCSITAGEEGVLVWLW